MNGRQGYRDAKGDVGFNHARSLPIYAAPPWHSVGSPPVIRLAQITLREILLPLIEPFRSASGEIAERRILLLEISDSDGAVAWSECVAQSLPTYSPDTVDTCWIALSQWLLPRALGVEFADPAAAHPALDRDVRGHRMALAAVEMGVWAMAATKAGLPLATLLARSSAVARERGSAPKPLVETGVAIGLQSTPDMLVQRAQRALDSGYRRIRIKIEPGRDVAWISATRDALGPEARIAADANCSYVMDDPRHMRALEALDGLGLTMIEQPLAHDDLRRHAALQQRLVTPICLDESITSLASIEDMLALGSGRMVNLKPGRVGGLQHSLEIHDACARAGVPVWCGGMLESGIGRAYNVALASLPNFTEPGDLSPSARYWARDVVSPEWTMDRDGLVQVPLTEPGLGIVVNTGMIDDLTVRSATFRAR